MSCMPSIVGAIHGTNDNEFTNLLMYKTMS